MDHTSPRYYDLDIIKTSDGSKAVRADGSAGDSTGNLGSMGRTIAASTYVIPLGTTDAPVPSQVSNIGIHLTWAAAVAATITVEVTNMPQTLQAMRIGPNDITDTDTTTGNWIQYNATLNGPTYVNAAGTNNTVAAYTVTAGGTNAGGAMLNVQANAFRRMRVKIVATVGGLVRCAINGKQAS